VRPAELVAIGLDHTTAGIELRERLAFAGAELPAALKHLANPSETALEQTAILSTCNQIVAEGETARISADSQRFSGEGGVWVHDICPG
jgi:glutamyl-tRNA reductase